MVNFTVHHIVISLSIHALDLLQCNNNTTSTVPVKVVKSDGLISDGQRIYGVKPTLSLYDGRAGGWTIMMSGARCGPQWRRCIWLLLENTANSKTMMIL